MVKSSASSSSAAASSSSSCKYKGVRKRTWGKYVSEIRLPNSRERIWLGSYDTAEKAARAFDAAQFCLRGRSGRFNFPDDPPEIVDAGSMTPAEIQAAAARYARLGPDPRASSTSGLDTESDSLTSHMGSPGASVSGGAFAKVDFEMTEIPLDDSFLDQIFTLDTESNSISDFGLFPGFDDLFVVPRVDCWSESNEDMLFSDASSSLWNF